MLDVTVGHEIECTIIYLDANGNPMQVAPTPDSSPAWTSTGAPVDSLTVSSDGTVCDVTALAAGADALNLTVTVGGNSYTASLPFTVEAPPQELASISINAVVK
jgi:hypothetical protein